MEDLIKDIKNYFDATKKKLTYENIKKSFHIKGESQTNIFDNALQALIESGDLFLNEKKEYETIKNRDDLIVSQLKIAKNGKAYINYQGKTIIIDYNCLNGALDKDTVIIKNIYENHKSLYGEVYKVIKRHNPNIIFEVVGDGLNATLVPPVGFNTFINVELSKNDMKKLHNGDHVLVSVGTTPVDNVFKGTLEEFVKETNGIKLKTALIARKFNVNIEFSDEALKEAKAIPTTVTEEDIQGRIDLRDKKFFTIDCDSTKDRDDAVCVEKDNEGNYVLYTSISHVSHYVKRGSALFEDAVERCTSHYPNDDCIPMLPHELSSGICSLNENVDRLVRTFRMVIDKNGKMIDHDIFNAVIRSRKEMKYSDVNKVLKNESVPEIDEFKNDLFLIKELNLILEKKNEERDSLNFNTDEIKFKRDDQDNILDICEEQRGDSERIIENFMVLTNALTSEEYSWAPIIYRIHPEPEIERLKNTLSKIRSAGIEFNQNEALNESSSRRISKAVIKKLNESDKGSIFKELLIKSMARALYDTKNEGHYALALDYYSHTTSPIRRLADLLLHSIIDEIMEGNFDSNNYDRYIEQLNNYCNRINEAERIDFEMEKAAEAVNIAEYACKHIGEEIEVRIESYTANSLWLTGSKHIRGLLDFDDIEYSHCYYDRKKDCIIDRNTKTKYKIGEKLYVLIKSADKSEGIVHFRLPGEKILTKRNYY